MIEGQEYYASKGAWNRVALEWFYINTGLNTFNDFKYVFAAIIGIYLAVKYPIIALAVAILFLPILRILGKIKIKYIAKRIEWLGVTEGTKVGNHVYELQQKTVELLEEINSKLGNLNLK